MGRITKCICDGCGKEIEKDPIAIYADHVDAESRDFVGGCIGRTEKTTVRAA